MPVLLLLEDESPLREIFRVTIGLLTKDIQVYEFSASESALTHVKENWADINLYVLDIRVPGRLNGFELAKEIRHIDPETPIIMTSAFVKPTQKELETYNLIWMDKPWHLTGIPETILPLIK
ncbi:MAG: response regulator [Aggregatilineales bacterium]